MPFPKGYVPWNKGKTGVKTNSVGYKHTEKAKESMSKTRKRLGIKPPNRKGIPLKNSHKLKISKANKKAYSNLELRKKMSLIQKGEKAYWWKGGKTKELLSIRNGLEYRLWREAVYERDNYTCVWCGERGGKLNADHIKAFAHYPELRFAIDNGRTLCVDCHKQTDNFGGKSIKKND